MILLYSTNVYLKWYIQKVYLKDRHYVWCSPHFDPSTLGSYHPGATIPPTSNPCDIYRDLRQAVKNQDTHHAKIREQKASLRSLTVRWQHDGTITAAQKMEIHGMIRKTGFDLWRPLLYVIPYEPVKSRVQYVPVKQRAGIGEEFIIPDLHGDEFHTIEFKT